MNISGNYPFMSIAKEFGVDYTTVLMIADHQIHDRAPVGVGPAMDHRFDIMADSNMMSAIDHYSDEQRARYIEAERLDRAGKLRFVNGKWIQLP